MEATYKYDKVARSDTLPDPEYHPEPHSKTAIVFCLFAAVLFGFLTSTAWSWISHLPPSELTCGASVAEAQALGCKFDLLSTGWVPHQCFDEASEIEYREWIINTNHSGRGPFPYFKDKELSQPIDGIDALSKYDKIVYTTMEEHLAHCAQLMKRTLRAALSRSRMAGLNMDKDEDGAVITSEHIAHCVKILWTKDEYIKRYNYTSFIIPVTMVANEEVSRLVDDIVGNIELLLQREDALCAEFLACIIIVGSNTEPKFEVSSFPSAWQTKQVFNFKKQDGAAPILGPYVKVGSKLCQALRLYDDEVNAFSLPLRKIQDGR
ncbi:hypothetical protein SLS60_004998 [Paraconiothyrium brasiliense]|uniref:Uncharacterized protein n=1 Tax=Paraconiothyrium brasiliense TaxID=300254 RepID=A0ABR3RME6_9PLEO